MSIENDIPIPPKPIRGITEWSREVRSLKIGQSRFFASLSQRNSAKAIISKLGGRCCVRRERSEEGVEGWRLWRTA